MPKTASPVRRLAVAAGLLFAVLVACGREITAPVANTINAFHRVAALSFAPKYETALPAHLLPAALQAVAFERVRITLRREDGTIALDTVVMFPVGSDSLTVTLNIPLPATAPTTGVPLNLHLGYVNAAGDTVFRGGPVPITVVPTVSGGGTPAPTTPVQVPVQYTGTGASASAVVISPKTFAGVPGQSTTFTGRALDSGGNPIAGTPIVFASSNSSVVTVNETSGLATLVGRGTAKVYALLLTGPADSAVVTVSLPASQLALSSGGNQTAPAGSTLPVAIVARVLASDGVGVAGTTVTFAASGGGTVTPSSAVSDASGNVSTQWKLGATAGAQTLTVTATGLSGSPLTVNATAQAVVPTKLVVQTGPVSSKAGAVLPPISVAAQDAGNNTVATFTGDISVAIGTNPGSATLAGTTTVKAVNGIATFSDLKLNRPGTGYTLVFSSSGLSPAASAGFDILTGSAARLVFGSMPAAVDAGIAIAPPVTVSVQDSSGNAVTSFTGAVTTAIGNNPGSATLGGTLSQNAVAGVATFNNLTINKSGAAYTLTASASGLVGATSAAFNVAPGAASVLAVTSGGGQSAVVASKLANLITVQLRDALGNGIGGQTLTFTPATSSGTVSPSSAATATDGTASFAWTLGSLVGAQTVSITLASPSLSTSVSATATAGAARQLAISRQPRASSAAAKADTVIVQIKDSVGAVVTSSTAIVTLSIASGPSGATSMGPTSVAAVAGVASFSGIAFDKAGTYTLTFASAGLTSATSTSFVVTAGWPKSVTADSGNAQTASAGQPLPQSIIARLNDQYGNAVAGRSVIWGTPSNGGALTGTTTVTDTGGRVRAHWSLGLTAGPQSVVVSAVDTGLTTNSATFTATANAVAYSKLWDGSSSTSWSDTANWTPTGVPAATDSVKIGVGTYYPVLTANTTVAGFTMDPATTMSLGANTLTVNGTINVSATGFFGTTGSKLVLGGSTGSLVGFFTVDTLRFSGGTYSLSGSINVTGNLAITSGTLNVSNGVTLSGGLDVSGTGAISQTAGTIGVGGSVRFDGTGSSIMSSGALNVAGNFTTLNTVAVAMIPPHGVQFDGGSAQLISLANSSVVTFGNVTFSGAGTKTLAAGSQMAIDGTGFVLAGSGAFTGTARTALRGAGIVDNSAGSWNVDSIYIGVNNVTLFPTSLPAKYFQLSSGSVTLQNDLALPNANVVVFNGQLNPNSHALTIGKNFSTTSNGLLVMQSGTSAVTVGGSATFGGGAEQSFLTAGTLTLHGNFAQTTNPGAFVAGPQHRTVLTDTTHQTISFANPDLGYAPGCAESCFGQLLSTKPSSAVSFLSDVKADSSMLIDGVDTLYASGRTLHARGDFSANGKSNGAVYAKYVRYAGGISRTGGNFAVDTLVAFGTNQLLAGWESKPVIVRGSATLPARMYDAVIVDSGFVIPAPGKDTVAALITRSSGALKMISAADTLIVQKDAKFAGGTTTGLLTAGTLIVGGNLDMIGAALDASGSHTVVMRNDTARTLAVAPQDGTIGFQNLAFEGSGLKDVLFTVNIPPTVKGNLVARAGSGFVGTYTPYSQLTVAAGGAIYDSTATGDAFRFARLFLKGTLALPKTLAVQIMHVSGQQKLFDSLTTTGVVTVGYGALDLNGHKLHLTGSGRKFETIGTGVLKMKNAADTLLADIGNEISFTGGATDTSLTAGVIIAHGNITQAGDPEALSANGTHKTVILGDTVHLQFANPGQFTSHFARLIIATGSPVFLNSDVYSGTIETGTEMAQTLRAGLAGYRVFKTMGAELFNMTFDGVSWVLGDGAPVTSLNGISFINQDPTATQLSIGRTGTGTNGSIPWLGDNWTFSTPPTTGYYLGAQDTDGASPNILGVNFVNPPTPPSRGDRIALINGATTNWPFGLAISAVASGNWNDAATWSPAVVPGPNDDVTIGGERTVTLTANAAVHHLTLSTASLNTAASILEVTGDVIAAGNSIWGYGVLWFSTPGAHDLGATSVPYLDIDPGVTVNLTSDVMADGDVSVAGMLNPSGHRLTAWNFFDILSGGGLVMKNAADWVEVYDAWFAGVDSDTLLTAGTLVVNLAINQSTNPKAFAPTGTHLTRFIGSGGPSEGTPARALRLRGMRATAPVPRTSAVRQLNTPAFRRTRSLVEGYRLAARQRNFLGASTYFANPGYAASHFNILQFENTSGYAINFESDVYANRMQVADTLWSRTIYGSGGQFHTYMKSASLGFVHFENLVVHLDGGGPIDRFTSVSMSSLLDGLDNLVINRTGTLALDGLSFGMPTTGRFLVATTPSALTLTAANMNPGSHGGNISIGTGVTFNATDWPASRVMSAAISGNWWTRSTWSPAGVPTRYDDVTILPASLVTLDGPAEAKNVSISMGGRIAGSYDFDIFGNWSADTTINTVTAWSGTANLRNAANVSGRLPAAVFYAPVTATGPIVAGSIDVRAGAFAINGQPVLVSGAFMTDSVGLLKMILPADYLRVGTDARFSGSSTDGVLTNGVLRVGGNLIQTGGDPAAFSASGSHRTILTGETFTAQLSFDNPGATGTTSHFGIVQVGDTGSRTISMQTSAVAVTSLERNTASMSLYGVIGLPVMSVANIHSTNTLSLNHTALKIYNPDATATFSNANFLNLNIAGADQLTVESNSATPLSLNFAGLSFVPPADTTSFRYVVANYTGPGSGSPYLTLNLTAMSPISSIAVPSRVSYTPTVAMITWVP